MGKSFAAPAGDDAWKKFDEMEEELKRLSEDAAETKKAFDGVDSALEKATSFLKAAEDSAAQSQKNLNDAKATLTKAQADLTANPEDAKLKRAVRTATVAASASETAKDAADAAVVIAQKTHDDLDKKHEVLFNKMQQKRAIQKKMESELASLKKQLGDEPRPTRKEPIEDPKPSKTTSTK